MDKQIDAETDKATALWEIRQLDTLYRLLSRGVQAAKSFPKFLETIRSIEENENIAPLVFPNSRLPKGPKAKKSRDEKYKVHKQEADELASFAEFELADGLSSLHSLLAVRLCTILEVTVDDLACAALRKPDKWTQPDVVGKLSGPLLQFLEASEEDRVRFLCDELRLSTRASLKVGVGKFEDLLTPIGLGGTVADSVRRTLLEIIEVRNTIVHRAGVVDKQLKARCPWLTVEIGETIKIDHFHYWKYLSAVTTYLAELYRRANHRGILKISKERMQVVDEIKQTFLALAESDEADLAKLPRRSGK